MNANRDPLTDLEKFKIYTDIAISILSLNYGVTERLEYKVWWAKQTDKYDISTNAPLVYAKVFGVSSMKLATELSDLVNILIAGSSNKKYERK